MENGIIEDNEKVDDVNTRRKSNSQLIFLSNQPYFIIENLFRIILFQQKANLESKNQMFLYHIFLEF